LWGYGLWFRHYRFRHYRFRHYRFRDYRFECYRLGRFVGRGARWGATGDELGEPAHDRVGLTRHRRRFDDVEEGLVHRQRLISGGYFCDVLGLRLRLGLGYVGRRREARLAREQGHLEAEAQVVEVQPRQGRLGHANGSTSTCLDTHGSPWVVHVVASHAVDIGRKEDSLSKPPAIPQQTPAPPNSPTEVGGEPGTDPAPTPN
jgi:hypothetical protein